MTDASLIHGAVYLADADALVLADLHVGRAASASVDFPLDERDRIVDRLRDGVEEHEPRTVVVAGDVLDAFDRLPRGVDRTIAAIRDAVGAAGARFVVTPGNHDGMLGEVYDGIRSPEFELDDGTVVCHGHTRPETDAERYVIGHDHPAIDIEGRRFPCALAGPAAVGDATVLVLPAFSPMTAGTAVNRRDTSDFRTPLVGDLGAFHPIVTTAEETRRFPPLRTFRDRL
jgi:putative SbcD/Mre11-related phosphoesterase